MANMNIEQYIKDMPPDLQEAARKCSSKEELMELAGNNDVELSMDALEAVSGGCFTGDELTDEQKEKLTLGNDIFS